MSFMFLDFTPFGNCSYGGWGEESGNISTPWPPSPFKMCMALFASDRGGDRWGSVLTPESPLWKFLETTPPDYIVCPPVVPSTYQTYVPTNTFFGQEKTFKKDKKVVREWRVPGKISYVWRKPEDIIIQQMSEVAQKVTRLGRAQDFFSARVREGNILPPEFYEKGRSGVLLWSWDTGTAESLVSRFSEESRFKFFGGKPYFIPPSPVPRGQFWYGKNTQASQHWACFKLGSSFPATDQLERGESLKQTLACFLAGHLEEDFITDFVKGHGSKEGHLQIVPLPTLHQTVKADGKIRRVLFMTNPSLQSKFQRILPYLQQFGLDPCDGDGVSRQYTSPSKIWDTVTPAILPVPAKAHNREIEGVRKILSNMNLGGNVVDIHVQPSPLFSNQFLAREYLKRGSDRARDRFRRRLSRFVRVEFDKPIPGPLVLGDGRFFGLGVCAGRSSISV